MRPDLRAAIVQESASGRVLMLAWMDDEALRRTRQSGEAHFFSRSRAQLWRKGETSGNTLSVDELREDCDGDAILLRVTAAGPACHTGSVSCFAPWLWRRIAERARARPEGSYVAGLLESGVEACARKVGEEGVEAALAAVSESDERVVAEVADLWFHSYVLLAARGLDPAAVEAELERRAAAEPVGPAEASGASPPPPRGFDQGGGAEPGRHPPFGSLPTPRTNIRVCG